MKRIACMVMAVLLLLTVCGCAFVEGDIVYPNQNIPCILRDSTDSISQVAYYDYQELSAVSDIVVVADVVENQCEYYQSNCFRLYAKIAVNDALKGTVEKGETLFVGENGYAYRNEAGERGDTYTSCGGPLLEKGNRVLLFLVEPEVQEGSYFTTANGEGLWTFYAMPIGKFFYDKDGKYHASATYAKDYTDTYCNYSMLTDYTPKTLNEIKKLICG